MSANLLKRRPHAPPKGLPFIDDLSLTYARAHEICGPSRRTLALLAAQNTDGHIFWVHSHWERDRLLGNGIRPLIDPTRITFVTPKRYDDIMWSVEEILRSGCIPLVIAELPEPPPLTPIRRLHLAAETGAQRKKVNPIALILTPGNGGAAGVETRWHITPRYNAEKSRWRLQRRRARMEPPATWVMEIENGKPHLHHAPIDI
jgi:protein ImuA